MSILLLTNRIIFFLILVYVIHLSLSHKIIDIEIGDDNVLDCPINRNNWTHPSIFQWRRAINNYSIPIVSQFDNYPVHIDDLYRKRYNLFTNGSLKIENIQLNDNDTFECRLILIDRGLLDLKEQYFITLRVNEQPRFISQSSPLQIANHYSTVNFLCQIYGVPYPTVTWYKVIQQNKQTIDDENLQLLSVNSQNLILENIDDRRAGKYKCIGKNRLGIIQNDFQLLIRGSIYWRNFPKNQTIKINDSITLKCEGESSEPLQYEWLKDNVSISDTILSQERIRTYSDGMLHINNIEPSDHGSYVCVISIINSTSIRSKPAFITVKYPPRPSHRRQINNLTLIQGSLGICPCLLDAYPPIQSVSWYRNGRSIRIQPKGGAYTINSEYALVIKSVESDDEGHYFCRAQNSEGFGHDSKPIYIEIKEPIRFISKLESVYYVHEKDQLILPCVVSANPQPTTKWFKNSIELNKNNENLTIEAIEKTDHGLYICQASNNHTTTNISTLVIVESTTPQAPFNVHYKQISSTVLLSWEAGYDGGRPQYFIIWYRMIQTKKQNWHQIRVIPNNATDFFLFDLQFQQTYEVTIVGENEFGLGFFSPIITIYVNNNQDLSIGYLHQLNQTDILRPLPPTDLYLSQSGSNLYITWNHPNFFESPVNIHYYVIQWRSTIFFNNQQSQQFIIVEHPIRSYILKDIKQSKYIIQIMSYSDQGTYSIPIESEIIIQYNSILAYHGSNHLLLSILCFLTLLTVATLCICLFFILKCYYNRGSYYTDQKSDSKSTLCGCFPSIHYRLDDCSPTESDRYHTSLLKSIDLQSSPIYTNRHPVKSQTSANSHRSPSPLENFSDSSISLAKVTTIPRCRDSIISNTMTTSQLTEENSNAVVSSALTFAIVPSINDETKMTSFFQPIPIGNTSPVVAYSDVENRKNSSRLPLEAVPELSELHVANSRYSFAQALSSTVHIPNQSNSIQPSPVLITFDSSSVQRRT